MTAKYDFKLNQGTDLIVPFSLSDESGKPCNLLGFKAQMQLRVNCATGKLVDTFTCDNECIKINADKGVLSLVFKHEQTAKYPATCLAYDIELVSTDNNITRIVEGKITVSPEVTRVESSV